MDTDAFRYVIVLAECRSISEAARKLFITQPALTKHLNKLEETLGIGVRLFDRSVTPIKITPAGEIFLEYSKKYVDMETEMKERLNVALQLQKGSIKVSSTSGGEWYLADHIGTFLKTYKDIILEIQDNTARVCEQLLEREEIDIAIYTDPVCSDKVEYVPLYKDRLQFAVSWDHFLLEGKDIENNSLDNPLELDISEFRNPRIKYVLSTPPHGMYRAEQEFFKKYSIEPTDPLRIDFINTRYSIACSSRGIVMVPYITARRIAQRNLPVFCTVKGGRLSRQIIIAKKKGRPLSAAGETFWNFIIQHSFGTQIHE